MVCERDGVLGLGAVLGAVMRRERRAGVGLWPVSFPPLEAEAPCLSRASRR